MSKWMVVILLVWALAGSLRALALDPSAPPGQNFDLSHYYLTLPVDSLGGTNGNPVNIAASQLVGGYTNSAYFYTGSDGAMVFVCPAVGATTTGSSNPRTELREQLNTSDNSVDWLPNGLNMLTAQCVVTSVAAGGEMAIAQVHGYSVNLPLVILYYDNTQNQGTIDATVKFRTDDKPINGETDSLLTFGNVGPGNMINYRIMVSNGLVSITVNGVTRSQNIYATDANWANVSVYFKAGSYYVNNGGTSTASQVSFYALTATHAALIGNVVQSGSNLIFSGACGLPASPYYVLASTNLAQPVSNWVVMATNFSDGLGNFQFSNAVSPAPQKFFYIKLP